MDRERGSLCLRGSRPRRLKPIVGGPAPVAGVGLRHARSLVRAIAVLISGDGLISGNDGIGARSIRGMSAVATAIVGLSVIGPVPAGAVAGIPVTSVQAPSTQAAPARVASGSAAAPSLVLMSQTPWVTPNQPFDLQLRMKSGAPAASRLGLSVSVYSCLSTVSSFDQTVSLSGQLGPILSHTVSPIRWSSLPAVGGGGVDLSLPVTVAGTTSTAPASTAVGPGGYTIDLTSPNPGCRSYPSGVYPVRVQLVDTSSDTAVGEIVTHLVYTNASSSTKKLRFAAVVPVATAVAPAANPSRTTLTKNPLAALDRPSAASARALDGVIGAVVNNATVPITIAASPQAVQALSSSNHQAGPTALAELATTPAVHQFLAAPYAPINASDLVNAGLGTELTNQVKRGTQMLTSEGLNRSATGPAPSTTGASGPWVTNDGLDSNTLTQLRDAGYQQLVLPKSDVTFSPMNGSAAEPFIIDTPHGSTMTAVTSNADLAARFNADPGNPVLAAHQLLAELAQIYYEAPNSTLPRAVVAVAPTGWAPNATFVQVLLASLNGSPIVQAVTLAGLFATFTSPRPCRDGCRLIVSAGSGGLPAAAVRNQRAHIDAFNSSLPASAHLLTQELDNLVLSSESELLRSAQQRAVLHNAGLALDAQLAQLGVAAGQTITLTSRNGRIPVTVLSTSPYPITGVLTLTSGKLLFANGKTQLSQPTTLSHSTNVTYTSVQARVLGEFKVDVTLRAPTGGLVLAEGVVSVRSTTTSIVGVLLSLGAVGVLLLWWIRTVVRRRSGRRRTAVGHSGNTTERIAGEASATPAGADVERSGADP